MTATTFAPTLTRCNKCGDENVMWSVSKAGKNYLVNVKFWQGDYSSRVYSNGPHFLTCTPDPARLEALEAKKAAKEAREEAWAAAKAARVNATIGEVGEKITVTGTIRMVRVIEGTFGYRATTSYLYIIDTAQGTVKWFASRDALGMETGVEVTITATVKGHDEYQGEQATIVTRAKAL